MVEGTVVAVVAVVLDVFPATLSYVMVSIT